MNFIKKAIAVLVILFTLLIMIIALFRLGGWGLESFIVLTIVLMYYFAVICYAVYYISNKE